jgi:hypothetical protein
MHALTGVGPDAVASGKKKPSPYDSDMAIRANDSIKVSDFPWRAGRNASYNVEVDCPVRRHTGNRNDTDSAFKFQTWLWVLS